MHIAKHFRRLARQLLCLVFLGALALSTAHGASMGISGQSYETFARYYKENIDFINHNGNRYLLPLVLTNRGDVFGDGRTTYQLIGDTLNVTILTDISGKVIERCDMELSAPAGMEYGNATYNDFAISGYHSFALLMAMHADPEPALRYTLVTDTVSGMAEGSGDYTCQVGLYTLTCSRVESVASFSFQNNRAPAAGGSGDEAPEGEDEGAGLL